MKTVLKTAGWRYNSILAIYYSKFLLLLRLFSVKQSSNRKSTNRRGAFKSREILLPNGESGDDRTDTVKTSLPCAMRCLAGMLVTGIALGRDHAPLPPERSL